MAEIANLQM